MKVVYSIYMIHMNRFLIAQHKIQTKTFKLKTKFRRPVQLINLNAFRTAASWLQNSRRLQTSAFWQQEAVDECHAQRLSLIEAWEVGDKEWAGVCC